MAARLPPELRVDRRAVELHMRHYPLRHLIPTVLHDVENLPEGGALLVGNHGPLAIDTGLLIHSLLRDTDRIPRSLGDRFMFKTPLGRSYAASFGGVEANPENALALLRAGEWVIVYPGGARETVRSPKERYQLRWEGRFGFARIALQAQVPIIPVACVGLDEQLIQVLTHDQAKKSTPGKWLGKLVGKDSIPPVYLPRLRRTPYHYWFGQPVDPPAVEADDETALEGAARALQQQVKASLEALIAQGRDTRREKLQHKAAEAEAEAAREVTAAVDASDASDPA